MLIFAQPVFTGPTMALDRHRSPKASVITGSVQITGGAVDEPCRSLYIYDCQNIRVLHFTGTRYVELPEIPGRTGLLANWTTVTLSADDQYWSMGSTLFQFQGRLILVLYPLLPTPGLKMFAFDFDEGAWSDISGDITQNGRFDDSAGIKFDPARTFPYSVMPWSNGLFTPDAQDDTLWLKDGECVFVKYEPTGTTAPFATLDFFSDSNTGVQAIAILDENPYYQPKVTFHIHSAEQRPIPPAMNPGTNNSTAFSGKYTTPGQWQTITSNAMTAAESGLGNGARWVMFSAYNIGPGKRVGFRKVSFRPGESLSVYFSAAVNYRGNMAWMGYTTKSGEAFSFSLDEIFTLHIGRAAPVPRPPRKEGQTYSYSQANLLTGRIIPHLDRLHYLNVYLGGRNNTASPRIQVPLNAPCRFTMDPNHQSLDAVKADTYSQYAAAGQSDGTFYSSLHNRAFGVKSMMLGGVSHKGFLFHMNPLGQVVRIDERHRVPRVMYDIPLTFEEFDCGLSTTDGDGAITENGYDMFFTRSDPMPYNLPTSLRGSGRMGVEFWDAYARIIIDSIPTTGDSVQDAKLQTLVGRRGFFTGTNYSADGSDHYTNYWVVSEDGRHLFSNYLNTETGLWERLTLPAGTVVHTYYAFAGAFLGTFHGTNPVHVEMFEYDEDLFVIWTFAMTKVPGPNDSSVWPVGTDGPASLDGTVTPPSMMARFHYTPETDSLFLIQKQELLHNGERIDLESSVIRVDDRAGMVYIVGTQTGWPKQDVVLMSVHLDTFGFKYHGVMSVADRAKAGVAAPATAAVWDNRNVIFDSSVVSYNLNEPQAYVYSVERDPVNKVVVVRYRLASRDARELNVRVRVAYNPTSAGDSRDPVGFILATEATNVSGSDGITRLRSAPGGGIEHVFLHNIDADIPPPTVGYIQYEILPFDDAAPLDVCADADGELWVQGIIHGCNQSINSISVDDIGVASAYINNTSGCRECLTSGSLTPGAVMVKTGLVSVLRNSVLKICTNHSELQRPGCDFENADDSATMWISGAGGVGYGVICEATAAPGETVTFGTCSVETESTTSVISDVPVCEPYIVPSVPTFEGNITEPAITPIRERIFGVDDRAGSDMMVFETNVTLPDVEGDVGSMERLGGEIRIAYLDTDLELIEEETLRVRGPTGVDDGGAAPVIDVSNVPGLSINYIIPLIDVGLSRIGYRVGYMVPVDSGTEYIRIRHDSLCDTQVANDNGDYPLVRAVSYGWPRTAAVPLDTHQLASPGYHDLPLHVSNAPRMLINVPYTPIVGVAYTGAVSATGYGTITFTVDQLPAGLSMDTEGVITGTPTGDSGNIASRFTATNAYGYDRVVIYWRANATASPVITSGAFPVGSTVASYTTTVTSTGPSTRTYYAYGLPAGLSINSSSGVISGTPTEAGAFRIVIAVSCTSGDQNIITTENKLMLITPYVDVIPSRGVYFRHTVDLPIADRGTAYDYTFPVVGAVGTPTYAVAPVSGSISDSDYASATAGLPDGLSFNVSNGQLTGTPTQSGFFYFNIIIDDDNTQIVTLCVLGVR